MKQSYHFLFVLFLICFTTKLYSQSVPTYVPTNGLVGWWGFNGNAQDGSGNGNHGTVNGATLTTDRFGNQNGAYSFDGINDNILYNPAALNLSATFSFWVLPSTSLNLLNTFTQSNSGATILSQGSSNNPCNYCDFAFGYKEGNYGNGELNCNSNMWLESEFGNSCNFTYVSNCNNSVSLNNNWQNITLVFKPFSLIRYFNGTFIDSIITTLNQLSNSGYPMCIGARYVPGSGNPLIGLWNGKLDDIGIWNRALTQQEITNLYTSQLPTQTSLCLPTITTNTPTSIGIDSVVVGGDILNDGGSSIVLRGVCYSTTPNPNMGNPRTEEGSGIGSFTSTLRNLSPSTTYYARSYAKNSQGVVVYGNEVSFSTGPILGTRCPGIPSVTDIDGNLYHTVQIGTQCWTQSNLKVSKYRNGDNIPTGLSNTAWQNTTGGSYAIYNNDPVNDGLYGKLYNHYAVMDTRGLCPTGWHVPTDGEWNQLVKYLDPNADTICSGCVQSGIAGGALKSAATQPTPGGWNSPNMGASNSSGFTAVPGGQRHLGFFFHLGNYGDWWTSSNSQAFAWNRYMGYNLGVGRDYKNRTDGFSIRCLKDVIPTVTTTTVSGITATSATTGGNVSQDGGASITARGVAYGTSATPTTSGTITTDGTGTGVFTSTLTGLMPSTTYFVRAYATNSNGTAYGNEVSFTTAPLSIGSSYAGGIIFDLDSSGQHGLVCAPSDQGNYPWGCIGTGIPNTSTAVGTGATNTAYIVAGCAQRPIAASVCADLVLNGYSDWYLPSIGEMQLMYSRLHLQGLGGFGGGVYWSSSQGDPGRAWGVYFGGNVGFNDKFGSHPVRAVRAF